MVNLSQTNRWSSMMFLMPDNKWARLLAYVTALVNQKRLLQNEYLIAENRILRAHLPARILLSDPERSTLAESASGSRALRSTSPNLIPSSPGTASSLRGNSTAPATALYPGRPPIAAEVEALIIRFARENSGWGYDSIVGALANLGHPVSDQTVGNILRRYRIAPAP